jgi:regulatory protein YycI of two-component signal transduction system YycFG
MDWSRAKTILILSFLLLNMMLGYELWAGQWGLRLTKSETTIIVEELKRIMSSKNIRLEAEIPTEMPKLKELDVSVDESDKFGKRFDFATPIKYSGINGKNMPNDALRRVIPYYRDYRLDPVLSSDQLIVLNQMHGTYPIFETRLDLYWVQEHGVISGYRQDYVTAESNPNQREQLVIPAHTALRSLLENYVAEGSVITDIQLGYYRGRYQLLLPSWRIALQDGTIYYVHAFTGAVEVPQNNGNE